MADEGTALISIRSSFKLTTYSTLSDVQIVFVIVAYHRVQVWTRFSTDSIQSHHRHKDYLSRVIRKPDFSSPEPKTHRRAYTRNATSVHRRPPF